MLFQATYTVVSIMTVAHSFMELVLNPDDRKALQQSLREVRL